MTTRRGWISIFAIALAGCGAGHADPRPAGSAEVLVGESDLQRMNRLARRGATSDVLFGTTVEDPFRSLEEDSEETRTWVDWQSGRTASAVRAWSRPETSARLSEVLRIGVIQGASTAGARVFFLRREGDREQPALFVREGTSAPRLLIDPVALGERTSLDWYFASPSGRLVAYGLSSNGDERSTLQVLDVATGEVRADRIEHCKWSDVTWLHDESGFYYRRYPREDEPNYDASQPDTYHARLFFHRLGTDPRADTLVYAPSDPTFFPGSSLSDDDRYLVVNLSRGWSQGDVLLLDRGARAADRVSAPDATHAWIDVRVGREHLYDARVHGGQLYLFTNEDAPRYRIQRASIDALATHPEAAFHDVLPEGDATLDAWAILGDRIAVHELVDVRSRVRFIDLDGHAAGEVTLPGRGEVSSFSGDAETGRLLLGFSSFVHAPSLLTVDRGGAAPEVVTRVECPVDLSQLEVSTARVPSRDGTEIPVTYVHRRGYTPDGNTPVLLTGYGGFNIALLPSFARHPLYWLERGGIYAVANLRGGAEFGEAWHRAGNLENKEHVFEDMEAVTRWFASSGISRPERIAITGGSNGGLLMGAMITRAPDAFGAAAAYVGLYDMVRYHRFPPAEIWATEYGSAEHEDQFRVLYGYSPYHRVRDGVRLPPILVETAERDTRVYWGHSTKFAARLQEASGEPDPSIWFFREQRVGHGAGTPVSVLVERYARMYAFIEHALGMEAGSSAAGETR